MEITKLPLSGLLLVEPQVFRDDRGQFLEMHHLRKYAAKGLEDMFVQDNMSWSKKGVLRGLHYQSPKGQGKLVSVIVGEIFDVAVDVRPESPTFGKWFGVVLSERNHLQFYLPTGFAHGFVVTSEEACVYYKCTDFYQPEQEHTILWNDPAIGIDWPVSDPVLSPKDAAGKTLAEATRPG